MPPFIKGDKLCQEKMSTKGAKPSRKPRADSIRNRELLLEAATQVFSAGGPQASLEAVARQAGVGIGTLYRHFPTREALFEAVYRHEVDLLATLADQLAHEAEPVEALRKWLHANVRLVVTKKGMVEALQLVAHGSNELKAYSFERLTNAIGLLLERGVAAGKMRSDIAPEDLLRTLVGIFYSQGTADWQPTVLRLVDVFVDGLRKR
jgi:AcrR family transcriptional regulator